MKTGERRQELDGVRGVAILLVLVGHAVDQLAPLAAAGVALFFVLSGYLITGLLLAERERGGRLDLRRFYARRFTRLAPPLFVMLAVMGVLLGSGWELLAPAAWVANYARMGGVSLTGYDHTWSLSVEEQFYLVWPLALLALMRLRRPVAALLVLVVALNLWRLWFTMTGHAPYAYYALEMAGAAILAGCLVALARCPISRTHVAVSVLWLVTLAALLEPITEQWWLVTPVVVTPLAAVFVGAARRLRWLSWRPLGFCGVASYSMYLWHEPVSQLTTHDLSLGGVTFGALVGLVAYRLVEVPVMRWRQGRRSRSVVAVVPEAGLLR